MKTALVAIASPLEIPYLQEWTDWHLSIGFDEIILGLNDWETKDYPDQRNGKVKIFPVEGTRKQLPFYNFCVDTFHEDYDWIGFIDIDEFICLKKHSNIKDLFADYAAFPVLALNWKLFGSNGKKTYEDKLVRERFTKSQKDVNQHVKSFINLKNIRSIHKTFASIHPYWPAFKYDPHSTDFMAISPENVLFSGPWNKLGSDKTAYIAHYATKSAEECKIRRDYRRADCGTPRPESWQEFFLKHDYNDVDNFDVQKARK